MTFLKNIAGASVLFFLVFALLDLSGDVTDRRLIIVTLFLACLANLKSTKALASFDQVKDRE